jgi:hypothetical protein
MKTTLSALFKLAVETRCIASLLVLAIAFAGCEKSDNDNDPDDPENAVTPPYAASTETWVFGGQTWSDAIHIPECSSPSFEDSDSEPQCRSYTSGTTTWYYYNWAYVNQNASKLCPSPWHVPAQEDFETLTHSTDRNTLSALWGYGGYARSSSMEYVSTVAYYWSSTQSSSNTNSACHLEYTSGGLYVSYAPKLVGFQVRCVK